MNAPAAAGDNEPWSIRRVLGWAADDFRRRGNPSARLDAELLLCFALDLDRIQLIVQAERVLDGGELGRYRELIKRRRSGEPIAYLLGEREFFALGLRVDRRVLIPRPDTETLVEVALERTRDKSMYGRALDLCTGSGCVAIAFRSRRPTWRVSGVDIAPEAIEVARQNALRTGTAWGLDFTVGDLFSALDPSERFDLITANPPYIPSAEIESLEPHIRDFEPRLALDGGKSGLDVQRAIAVQAKSWLLPGGILAVEVGHDQAPAVAELFEQAGLCEIVKSLDLGGHERVVSGRAPAR
jgi:release factor glutamine methyltransferase